MTSKIIMIGLVAVAFVAGSIMTSGMAYAAGDKNGKPFEALWDAIHDIQTQIDSISIGDSDWTISGSDMFSAVSGNVGIGTTTPGAPLEVKLNSASGGSNQPIKFGDSFGSAFLGAGSNRIMLATEDGTERLVIKQASGNVEIGTTAPHPGNQLIVDGPFPAIKFGDGNGKVGGLHAGTDRVILSTDDGTERLVIKQASGNVGIGTSTPTQLLTLEGAASPRVFVTDTDGSGVTTEIGAQDGAGFVGTFTATDLRILTGNDERMRITTDGKVGIGTTTPNSKLEVTNGYIELDTSSGTPPSADCDASNEIGRMKVDSSNNNLYVCTNNGWQTK